MSENHVGYILGINSAYHESAACLLRDGVIVAAIEEERLTRIKHAKPARVDNPNELPVRAIEACLRIAGIKADRVEGIGFSINPRRRLRNQDFEDFVAEGSWGSTAGEQQFFETVSEVPGQLKEMGLKGQFAWLDHHVCHAASAYYPSPFEDAAVLTVDGIGEESSTAFGFGQGSDLSIFHEISYPSSIGFLWEKLSKFMGFGEYDACKIMALAAYGNANAELTRLEKLIHLLPEGKFQIDNNGLRFRVEQYAGLEELFGIKRRGGGEEIRQIHCNIIAALQRVTDKVMLHMVEYLYEQTHSQNLCMAGGVALNCSTNHYIHERGPFSGLYIQPAAHDAGTAIGAALTRWRSLSADTRRRPQNQVYLGPAYTDEEIRRDLNEAGIIYERRGDIEKAAAELLSQGKVVGWFQGAMEFGPRALGNRSLLADPRSPDTRERLNAQIKHRESFRPFASSALFEEVDKWFDIGKPTIASEFMLVAYPAREAVKDLIPSVLHVDGTSRIQIVKREVNPRYHALISEFFLLTGIPLVLNTSFNDDEPIVCTVQDALNTFSETHIDYLAIGDCLVDRNQQPNLENISQLGDLVRV